MEQVKALADRSVSSPTGTVQSRQLTPSMWLAPTLTRHKAPQSPATPIVPVECPRTSSTTSTNPSTVLDELVASVTGVSSAILASVDGYGIARSVTMADEAAHPAMLAAAVGLAHQLVAMGHGDQLRQLVVDHDAGRMLVWPIGAERVLAVLADTSVDQAHLRQFVQTRARVLVGTAA